MIRFYPAWKSVAADTTTTLYVDEFGSFTDDIAKAVHFGNMRMAAIFSTFRQPANPSFYGDRKFAVLTAIVGPRNIEDVTEACVASGWLK